LPHVEIREHALWSGTPPEWKLPVSGELMGATRKRNEALSRQHEIPECWEPKVADIAVERLVGSDGGDQRAGELRVTEKLFHDLHVLREPKVVVREIANDPAARLCQGRMTVQLAVARALRVVEEPDPLVAMAQIGDDVATGVGYAVANDEDFDLIYGLSQGTSHRVEQCWAVIVSRHEDSGTDRRVHEGASFVMPASDRSRAMVATINAPSATLLRGGGPPAR